MHERKWDDAQAVEVSPFWLGLKWESVGPKLARKRLWTQDNVILIENSFSSWLLVRKVLIGR